MRIIRLFFIGICLISLASCASFTTPKAPPAQNQTQTWESRVKTLSLLKTWDLKALIAIRNNAKQDNLTANLQWQQAQQHYQLMLFGPLGAGAVTLKGSPNDVTLQTSNGQIFHAATPEILLAEQTNWHLPISDLYYWIRGLPAPSAASEKQFDAFHHLTLLKQQGWQIQFLNYTSVNQVDVPNKIIFTNPDFYVKIIIKQWVF